MFLDVSNGCNYMALSLWFSSFGPFVGLFLEEHTGTVSIFLRSRPTYEIVAVFMKGDTVLHYGINQSELHSKITRKIVLIVSYFLRDLSLDAVAQNTGLSALKIL